MTDTIDQRLHLPKAPGAIISGVIGRDDDAKKGRRYIRPSDNLVLDSVTHVLERTGDQGFIKNWYSKLAGQVLVHHFQEISDIKASDLSDKGRETFEKAHRGRGPTDEEAVGLARQEFMAEKIKLLSEIKADIGSHQHHVLEALLLDQPIPDVPEHLVDVEVDDDRVDHDAISDGLLQFFADFPDAIVLMAEATVANPAAGTAGTLDLVVEFPRGITIEGVTYLRLLIDLKAGKWLKADMRAQLAAYRFSTEIWIDNFGNVVPMLDVDGAAVLHLRRDYDDGYKLIIVDAETEQHQWFLDRVGLYRKTKAQPKKLGVIAYPPLPDGSQPLPLIEDLDGEGFSRCRAPLRKAGLRRLEDIACFSESEIRAVRGIGEKTIEACRATLTEYGLNFKEQQEMNNAIA